MALYVVTTGYKDEHENVIASGVYSSYELALDAVRSWLKNQDKNITFVEAVKDVYASKSCIAGWYIIGEFEVDDPIRRPNPWHLKE